MEGQDIGSVSLRLGPLSAQALLRAFLISCFCDLALIFNAVFCLLSSVL